ncbi:MAG: PA2778 family cysteine peptidase [Rhodoferax sp.]|nr:PA2778 family cysteine peptidase [Rhodoferax sp.]
MIRRHARLAAPALAGVFVCALLLLGGCATPQVSQLSGAWPSELPAKVALSSTPFIAQEDYECGPAALAMVLQSAGLSVTAEQLVDQVYLPNRKGSLQIEVLAASRRNGLPGYVLAPQVNAVLREVATGHPVLVFQNLSLPIYPVWHFAVVMGYDRERNTVLLHSGRTQAMEMSLYAFERTWERGGYWALVALPTSQLPATAQPENMARAIAALERVQPGAAQNAYITALAKWPTQRALMLGAGNAAYALQQWETAESAYRAATLAHPDFADAWNNLAEVQLEQGKKAEAQTAIAKAVALGGVRLPLYLELQKRIATR